MYDYNKMAIIEPKTIKKIIKKLDLTKQSLEKMQQDSKTNVAMKLFIKKELKETKKLIEELENLI